MEVFVDFGLFEVLVGLGLAAAARVLYSHRAVGVGVLLASAAAPVPLVVLAPGGPIKWLAVLCLLLFRDEEHVDRWCAARELSRGATITPEQTWRLADGWYRNKVEPDWRRHTLEETEALLSSIGLTSAFWNVRG